jgi:hypothetical protein
MTAGWSPVRILGDPPGVIDGFGGALLPSSQLAGDPSSETRDLVMERIHEIAPHADLMWDATFLMWLETGHGASRPPGEVHGPFPADVGCLVLDGSFHQRMERSAA